MINATQKGFVIPALIAVIAIIALGGFAYYSSQNSKTEEKIMERGKDTTMMEKDGEEMMEKKDEAMMKDESAMEKEDEKMMKDEGTIMGEKGSYEAYSPEKLIYAEKGKVVLFFKASWCPTCRALDANIRANLGNIPEGITILDVDYDNSTALKQKYGVTYQHTLVQVDSKGNQIAKWSNSPTLASLLSQVK
jgi:thiol-disulfide isomerase/thioredoxin